jgi:hypothetical protein
VFRLETEKPLENQFQFHKSDGMINTIKKFGHTDNDDVDDMYTVCLKSKCTDFPMDELEM